MTGLRVDVCASQLVQTYSNWSTATLLPYVWCTVLMKVGVQNPQPVIQTCRLFTTRLQMPCESGNVAPDYGMSSSVLLKSWGRFVLPLPQLSSPCILVQGMQAQNAVWGPAVCTSAAALLNVPLTALLTRQYGFWGAACANGMSRVLQLALVLGMFKTMHCASGIMHM